MNFIAFLYHKHCLLVRPLIDLNYAIDKHTYNKF
jgi:hypothetical protein